MEPRTTAATSRKFNFEIDQLPPRCPRLTQQSLSDSTSAAITLNALAGNVVRSFFDLWPEVEYHIADGRDPGDAEEDVNSDGYVVCYEQSGESVGVYTCWYGEVKNWRSIRLVGKYGVLTIYIRDRDHVNNFAGGFSVNNIEEIPGAVDRLIIRHWSSDHAEQAR